MLGEVGWAYWEELNVIDGGGKNYGWPIYGGMNARWQFNRWASPTPNLRAEDTASVCDNDYFLFQDLLLEDTLNPRPFFSSFPVSQPKLFRLISLNLYMNDLSSVGAIKSTIPKNRAPMYLDLIQQVGQESSALEKRIIL